MSHLILDVDSETEARYQLAADREGVGLFEWIREYLDVASDPDSGQVVDVRLEALVRDVLNECSHTSAPSRQRLREACARAERTP